MGSRLTRRHFFEHVGHGTLLATLGSAAVDLGFISTAFAEDLDARLDFGDLEPLVNLLAETPSDQLQSRIVDQVRDGTPLKTLIGAGALANARTFGGEDYVGFHTFMALGPALRLSALMPEGEVALPVLKVLLRNTQRIQEFGGKSAEVLHRIRVASEAEVYDSQKLLRAIDQKDKQHAEQVLAGLIAQEDQLGLDGLIPAVQDHPEVHRTVLPYRAWEMREIVGTQHALTLLRQSLRYCIYATPSPADSESSEQANLIARLFDEFHLHQRPEGANPVEDVMVRRLSETLSTATPDESAASVASALSEGWSAQDVGQAISLAASLLVLRDAGRLPQYEDKNKLAGCVHGDSVGVHASDAANAWRHLATVTTGRHQVACLLIGAWQVARDRQAAPNLMAQPLPSPYQLDRVRGTNAPLLIAELDEAIRFRLQAQAIAVVQRYGQLSLPHEPLFACLAKYAVSEDGALHAEKYFHTVWDDFHATRPSMRWQHLLGLARVTASEFGTPAPGRAEARELLKLPS